MKIVVYSPFPSIDTEDNYNLLVEQVKNSHIHPVTELPLGYEEGDHAAWDKYLKHLRELDKWKQKHLKKFTDRLKDKAKKTNETYEIIDLYYPEEKEKALFLDYGVNDILFIHSHGNADVIGTGPFVLDANLLAKNLEILKLSKETPPTIVVWSCDSGVTENDCDSYAKKLRSELKELDYHNLTVIGIKAKIYIDETNKDPVTYIREKMGRLKMQKTIIPESKALELNATPGIIDNANIRPNDGLFTQASKINKSRKQKIQSEHIKQLDFNITLDANTSSTELNEEKKSISKKSTKASTNAKKANPDKKTNKKNIIVQQTQTTTTTVLFDNQRNAQRNRNDYPKKRKRNEIEPQNEELRRSQRIKKEPKRYKPHTASFTNK